MSRDDVQKLLGGYATGSLTPQEQQALFEAALEDQSLFDQIAKEQPLHDLLADSSARAQLLAALDHRPAPWYRRWASWGVPALATAMLVGGLVMWRTHQTASRPVEVAKVEIPAPAPVAESAPAASTPAPTPPAQPKSKAAPPPIPLRQAETTETLADKKADNAKLPEPMARAAAAPAAAPPKSKAAPAQDAESLAAIAGKKAEVARPAAPTASAALPPPPPPVNVLTGTVRDVAGAAVAGAEVKLVPNNSNAPVVTTQTAANGNFVAPVSAGAYDVEVNARGFQAFRRDAVAVDAAGQTQLPVTLQVGAATETVQVIAATGAVQQQSAQAGSQLQQTSGQLDNRQSLSKAAPLMAFGRAAAVAPKILRRNADGVTTPANANDLRTGDTIVIEITPTATGYLTLTETTSAQALVNGAPVEAGKPFDTPPIALTAAGQREFTAIVSDTAPAQPGGAGGGGGRGGAAKSAKKGPAAKTDAVSPQPITIRITVR